MKRFDWIFGVSILVLLLATGCNDSDGSVIGGGGSEIDQATVDTITAGVIVPVLQAVDVGLMSVPIAPPAAVGGALPCQDLSQMCVTGTAELCSVSETEIDYTFTDCSSESGAVMNGSISFDFVGTSATVVFDVSFGDLTLDGSVVMASESACLREVLDQFSVSSSSIGATIDASLLYCSGQWPQEGNFDMSISGAQFGYTFNVLFDVKSGTTMAVYDASGSTLLADCTIDPITAQTRCEFPVA